MCGNGWARFGGYYYDESSPFSLPKTNAIYRVLVSEIGTTRFTGMSACLSSVQGVLSCTHILLLIKIIKIIIVLRCGQELKSNRSTTTTSSPGGCGAISPFTEPTTQDDNREGSLLGPPRNDDDGHISTRGASVCPRRITINSFGPNISLRIHFLLLGAHSLDPPPPVWLA